MKTKLIIACTALLACASVANAQPEQTNDALRDSYNTVGISYTNVALGFDDDDDNFSLNGFSLDYNHGFSISKTLPMFIEAGARLNFGFHSDSEKSNGWKAEVKTSWISFSVPVNFAYKFGVGESVTLKPYTGINFKLNILGNEKYTETDRHGDKDSESYNFFDKDDWDFHRFQMGWQIGVDVQYKPFIFGLEYGIDFIKMRKDVNSSQLSVKVAYQF